MVQVPLRTLSFDEFLRWSDGTDQSFELIDGVPMPLQDPNANHEDVLHHLWKRLDAHCLAFQLPYTPRLAKQVKIKTEPSERERSRKADLVVFAADEWQTLKLSPSPAAAYVPPPMVVEVVSQNWRDDYIAKLAEYEDTGIREYWVLDYGAFGGTRYLGIPKLPTLSIYTLVDKEYQLQQFRGNTPIVSSTFPKLRLTLDELLGN